MSSSAEEAQLAQRRSTTNIKWSIAFAMIVPVLSVALRLLARFYRKVNLALDDYLIILAMVFVLIDAGLDIRVIEEGMGEHLKAIPIPELKRLLKTFYISEQFYGPSITFIKLSVLCLYRRIFAVQRFRVWCHINIALVIAWFIIHNFMNAFQCTPLKSQWNPEIKGKCLNSVRLIVGLQVPNAVLDLIILALPLTAISTLQLPKLKKVSLGLVFAIGFLSVVVAFIRLGIFISEAYNKEQSLDVTWYEAKVIWSNNELLVGVFAACAPCYAPLFRVRENFRGLVISLRYWIRSSRQRRSERLPEDGSELYDVWSPQRPEQSQEAPPPKMGVSATAASSAPTWPTDASNESMQHGRIMVRQDLSHETDTPGQSTGRGMHGRGDQNV